MTVKKVEELIVTWRPKPDVPMTVKFIAAQEPPCLLMRLRDIDRHSIPDGDIKKIIVTAVRDRLAKVEAR